MPLPVTANTRERAIGAGIYEITVQVVAFDEYNTAGLTALLRETAKQYVLDQAAAAEARRAA